MRARIPGLVVLIGVPAAAACSDGSTGGPVWTCADVLVPFGDRVECSTDTVQSAVSYTCNNGGDFNPNCPPPGTGTGTGGGGSTMDFGGSTSSSGAGSGSGSGSGGTSSGSSGATSSGGTSSGSTGSGSSGGTTDSSGSSGSSSGTSTGSSGGTGNSSGTSTGSSGGSGNSSGGGNSGGGSGGGTGGGPPWNCDPTATGVTCHKPPNCVPGAHPATCGACVPNTTDASCTPPDEGGCWVTGGGFVTDDDGKDTFGGNAMPMKDGTVRGEWENIEHGTGDNTHGQANYIFCRVVPGPGPGHPNGPAHNFKDNQVYFGGPADYNGADGYWFDVVAEDHGEPGRLDTYQITVRKGASVSTNQPGTVVFQESGTMSQGGNIQLHPPNGGHPATQSTLPSWVQLQP